MAAQAPIGRPLWGLVGVGGDTLAALGPDLASGVPCFIVAGPAKSGRSTILLSMARSFLAAGTPLVLVAPRPSPLRALASSPGVRRLFDRSQLGEEELVQAQTSFDERGVVLVDDAELLRDCDAGAELSRLIASGGDTGRALVFAGDSESIGLGFSGWQVDAKRARRGCLTAPATLPEGDLIGVRLPRGLIGLPPSPGRCLLHPGTATPSPSRCRVRDRAAPWCPPMVGVSYRADSIRKFFAMAWDRDGGLAEGGFTPGRDHHDGLRGIGWADDPVQLFDDVGPALARVGLTVAVNAQGRAGRRFDLGHFYLAD